MYVRNLFRLFCGGLCVQNVWIKSKLSNQQVLAVQPFKLLRQSGTND